MTTRLWMYCCITASLLLGGADAFAAAYKCTNPGGGISYSDTPCPTTVTKGEKLLGRGAGTNPLNDAEKAEFKAGVMSDCKAPRNVCECLGDTLAETLTYEEVMQAGRKGGQSTPDIEAKAKRALAQCRAKSP